MSVRFYTCQLLDDGVAVSRSIELNCEQDSEAILAGRALAESKKANQSYAIHYGDRLVYRHEGPHIGEMRQPLAKEPLRLKAANEA
jgi:hypothetical protein